MKQISQRLDRYSNSTNTNSFKKDPGFAGVLNNGAGDPIAGATVKVDMGTGNSKTLLGMTTTDQQGVYLFVYKYTGPSQTFTIMAIAPTGAVKTSIVTIKSNQFGLVNFAI